MRQIAGYSAVQAALELTAPSLSPDTLQYLKPVWRFLLQCTNKSTTRRARPTSLQEAEYAIVIVLIVLPPYPSRTTPKATGSLKKRFAQDNRGNVDEGAPLHEPHGELDLHLGGRQRCHYRPDHSGF